MRILFAGTPEFSILPLEAISGQLNNASNGASPEEARLKGASPADVRGGDTEFGDTRLFEVCGVLTNPDKPAGRGRGTTPPPIKVRAMELGMDVFQPEKLDEAFIETVKSLKPDILIVAAYSKIFKRDFLDIFPLGGINIHPSLLPKYRGPSPVQAAILSGDEETGVTVQRLALKMDAGDILAQRRIPLKGDETTPALLEVAFGIGSELLLDVLDHFESQTIGQIAVPQDERLASYCSLLTRESGLIDWHEEAGKIERMIRAFQPWPRAFTTFNGLQLFLQNGRSVPVSTPSGQDSFEPGFVFGIDKRYGILIQTGNGILAVEELQLKTRKNMGWRAFLNGMKDFIGSQLGG